MPELPVTAQSTPIKIKKLTGVGFWIMFTLAVIKDILDIIFDLTVVLSFLTIVSSFIWTIILGFYLFYNGVKLSTRTVASFSITTIISLIPFLNLLPETTFNLVMIRSLENSDKLKKITNIASKVV